MSKLLSSALSKHLVVKGIIGKRSASRKGNETDVLLILTGKTGRSIEGLSMFGNMDDGLPNQREILYDKGLKIRFNKVSKMNGRIIFFAEEVRNSNP